MNMKLINFNKLLSDECLTPPGLFGKKNAIIALRKTTVYVLFLLALLLSLISLSNNSARAQEGQNKSLNNEACMLAENISELKEFSSAKAGKEISLSSIKELSHYLPIVKDDFVKDIAYSRTEKVRFVGLSKKCIAPDGALFEWRIGATFDKSGKSIIHGFYLIYSFDEIFSGRRKFSFERFLGTNKEYAELISKEAVGKLNSAQFAEYMKSLGASPFIHGRKRESENDFIYKKDPMKDMASRLAAWDFSKRITVTYGADQIVRKILVRDYH